MGISAGATVLAAEGADLVERWRDLGPVLWLIAGGLAAAWLAVLGLLGAALDPRRVRPGAATLEPQGEEPPAVVNLITTDWDLRHEAIPATLVHLAARRRVDIDMVGDRTFVQVRSGGPPRPGDALTRYEEMVLDHVRGLANQTDDGRVPAEALTTGPDATAKRWWRTFRSAVVHDARRRGLSRPRWPAAVKAALVAGAAPVALALGVAASTLPDNPNDPDDNPASTALAAGIVCFGGLSVLAGSRSGERDTPAGREAAARWLGLQDLLEEDPLFAEQPPAAVAIWDHLLAHGTALGVAHGVVQSLPLGAESEREAWSSVGGRWRVVRVRYPRWLPPGYGRHPALVALLGIVQCAIAAPVLTRAGSVASSLREALDTGTVGDVDLQRDLGTELPAGVDTGISVALAVVTALAVLLALRGAAMVLTGLADLVAGRTAVEGRVLRRRERVVSRSDSGKKRYVVHLAVDDGSEDRIRSWRFRSLVPGPRGQTVRGRVSRWLRHVADLEVVTPPPEPAGAAPESEGDADREAAATTTGPPAPGMTLAGGPLAPVAGIVSAVTAAAGAVREAAAGEPATGEPGTGEPATGQPPTGGAPPGQPPSRGSADRHQPPPLPPAADLSAATGLPLARDPGAAPHPAALPGGSAIYRAAEGGHVQVVWVPAATIGVYRHLPGALRHELPDLGDEAYRARFGGGVMARRGDDVVMVTPHLPDLAGVRRDEIAAQVARAALDHAAATAPRPPTGPEADAPARADG